MLTDTMLKTLNNYRGTLLSSQTKDKAEKFIIWTSIISFIIHLLLIVIVNLTGFDFPGSNQLLTNPISAIYTPFSFILLIEVYLLVYHIPKSTTDYIAKQYEIITLIVIRRIFKDLANLDLTINWFEDKYDLQFTYDIISTIILFLLIYFFHKLNKKEGPPPAIDKLPGKVKLFIKRKQIMAALLVPVILIMALYTFTNWTWNWWQNLSSASDYDMVFTDVNNIFFDEFFTLLILTDVLLLLFSFFHTSKFHVFIRNSGFIISTILIRVSFSVDGILNNVLIIVAVLFGVLIQVITRQYIRLNQDNSVNN